MHSSLELHLDNVLLFISDSLKILKFIVCKSLFCAPSTKLFPPQENCNFLMESWLQHLAASLYICSILVKKKNLLLIPACYWPVKAGVGEMSCAGA